MRSPSRLLVGLATLLTAVAGLTVSAAQPASAAGPSYPATNPDPVAGYGEPPAGQVVADIRVVTGSSPDVACPAGYTKRYPDLNRGLGTQLNGKLSDYVYTCLLFEPLSSLNPGNPGIGELYVSSPVTAGCSGDDIQVPGDLNAGMVRFDVVPEEELYYCKHRPDTNGGSGHTVNPGIGVDYFPTPAAAHLRDVQFLAWDPPSLPSCITSDCVSTSIDAFSYLDVAATIEPYCQGFFGMSYHPMFQPWEYHEGGDRNSSVPRDANTWDLNAGVLFKTMIYGCVSYTTDPIPAPTIPNTITMSLPPAHVGDLVSLSALVDPTDAGGTVRFTSDGVPIPGCGALGFGSGGGTTWQAICSTRSLPRGTHRIVATYSGDHAYGASTGGGEESITQPTTTSVSSTGDDEVGGVSILKAVVTPTDGRGTVRFTSDGVTIPGCGALALGSGGSPAGQATCTTTSLPAGMHMIVAEYSGDADFASSTGSARRTVRDGTGVYPTRLVMGSNAMLNLGVAGASVLTGARIVQSSSMRDDTAWMMMPSNGYVLLENLNSGQCVTTDGIAGDALYQTECTGAPGQLWQPSPTFGPDEFSWLRNPATGLYLDVPGATGTDGAVLDAATGDGTGPGQTFLVTSA